MKLSIEKMIEDAFNELLQIGCAGETIKPHSNSNLVFPTRRDGKEARVSEQEIRFLFVKQLEKQNEFLYSVEAPTAKKYRFTGDGAPKIDEANGQSGSVDVCLYKKADTAQPANLIEFKALNPEQDSYSKDFLKLLCDREGLTNYFVQVIKNSDSGTYPSIEEKYRNAVKCAKAPTSDVKIFLCDMGKPKITEYEVVNGVFNKK